MTNSNSFYLLTTLLSVQSCIAVDSHSHPHPHSQSYSNSAFIQSASPSIIIDKRHHSNHQRLFQPKNINNSNINISNGNTINGINPSFGHVNGHVHAHVHGMSSMPLYARKKKDTTVGKGGKIQVKLLKHIAGTGSAGDVIMVAPAFFQNKLQKTQSAVRISDAEVAAEALEKAACDKEARENATAVKEKVEGMDFVLMKKAGPDGHLFGGIGFKLIMKELKKEFPQGCLDGKQVKITQIKDGEGKKLRGDIKETGEYEVTLALLKGVSADLKLTVGSE